MCETEGFGPRVGSSRMLWLRRRRDNERSDPPAEDTTEEVRWDVPRVKAGTQPCRTKGGSPKVDQPLRALVKLEHLQPASEKDTADRDPWNGCSTRDDREPQQNPKQNVRNSSRVTTQPIWQAVSSRSVGQTSDNRDGASNRGTERA